MTPNSKELPLTYCEKCKKVIFCKICPSCKTEADDSKIEIIKTQKIPKNIKKEVKEESMWNGPITRICAKCGNNSAYYHIMPPASLDEPPIVKHKCTHCLNTNTDYKN